MENLNLTNQGFEPISQNIKFRPKARLLSVLGEQLISNSIIAIKELVLNAYDADAKNVKINFIKDKNLKIYAVEIIDDGIGMTKENIINGWFTPATSLKTKAKKKQGSLLLKRPILGEKGVGRFACRRLGEALDIKTHPKNESEEFYFNIQWSQYDVEEDDVYLDEIDNTIYVRKVDEKDILITGTTIVINNLRDEWTENKIEQLRLELLKLVPPFIKNKDFKILIDGIELVNDIFLEKALFYIEGIIDSSGNLYYIMDTYPREIELKPGQFIENIDINVDIEKQLNLKCDFWKKCNLLELNQWCYYLDEIKRNGICRNSVPECGGFTFCAYAWNLDPIHKKRVGIYDKESVSILRNLCGVSIYRDGFRIWPYGSPGNDWLNLDKRAQGGQKPFHISNNQVIGYVGITEKENCNLKDTSSREGIIEDGFYFSDLRQLVIASFSLLENLRYRYRQEETPNKDIEYWSKDNVKNEIVKFSELLSAKAPELSQEFKKVTNAYDERKKLTETKINNLLEVSSSGVVFESVTHELISFLIKMDEQSRNIDNNLNTNPIDKEKALQSNILLKEALNIVLFEVKELQPFFKAARYQLKELDIKEIANKSGQYFKYKFKKYNIKYNVVEISTMKKKAVEGFLLQIFTNLIDNSLYWLNDSEYSNREILVTIDGSNKTIYFSDNGKGIKEEDKPFVFDAFFTQKRPGEGRGLGLYIIQEILANYRGLISVCDDFKPNYCNEKQIGTTFKIVF